MNKQEQLGKIGDYVRDALQRSFGQELSACDVFLGSNYLVMHIRGFVSPMEAVLVEGGEYDAVAASRGLVVQKLLFECKAVVQLLLGVRVEEFYDDWSYTNNAGMIIGILAEEQEFSHPPGDWKGLDLFKADVERLCQLVEKVPEKTRIVPFTPRMLVVQRDGILIALEKAMIEKGYEKQLRATKADLEKGYFHHNALFEPIIGRELEDVFIDWNMHSDRSLMCFVWK
ncbi:Na-translocating system protein MpsC family protein [Tumebacillus avium]|nr:Na-translocating system protein MpsC family protein [Tumebacillus avium]